MARRLYLLFGLLIFGCGGASTNDRVLNTAASRWHCPSNNIEVRKISGDMYRVAGCDHEADYSCEDSAGGECVRVSGI